MQRQGGRPLLLVAAGSRPATGQGIVHAQRQLVFMRQFSTSKEERDSFLAMARAEEEAEEAEERKAEQLRKKKAKVGGKEWDGESVSRKIVEKLRREGRGSDDDSERYERMARVHEYKIKRLQEEHEQEEKERVARIERLLKVERERKEAEEKEKEEKKKKGWFSSLFS